MSRQFWTQTTKPNEIKRLNKKLIIPSFSANCGQANKSLEIGSDGSYIIPILGYAAGFTANCLNAFTIDFWANLRRPVVNPSKILTFDVINSIGPYKFNVSIDPTTDIATFTIITTTATYSFTVNMGAYYYSWHRYTITFGTIENKLRFYLDKIEKGNVTTTGNFYNNANWGLKLGENFVSSFNGHVAEIKVYNTLKSQQDLFNYGDGPAGQLAANDLKAYIKCLSIDAATASILGSVNGANLFLPLSSENGANPASNTIDSINYPPLIYGASFIAAKASVANLTSSENVSLKFPLIPPSGVNFALAISWTDFQGVFQRRLLWNPDASVGNIDWAPQLVYYNGERLPPTFDFEIINIDGKVTCDLASDYTIELSNTSLPNDSTDITEVSVGTLIIDKTLAQNFPLTPFPLTFNSQQTY